MKAPSCPLQRAPTAPFLNTYPPQATGGVTRGFEKSSLDYSRQRQKRTTAGPDTLHSTHQSILRKQKLPENPSVEWVYSFPSPPQWQKAPFSRGAEPAKNRAATVRERPVGIGPGKREHWQRVQGVLRCLVTRLRSRLGIGMYSVGGYAESPPSTTQHDRQRTRLRHCGYTARCTGPATAGDVSVGTGHTPTARDRQCAVASANFQQINNCWSKSNRLRPPSRYPSNRTCCR